MGRLSGFKIQADLHCNQNDVSIGTTVYTKNQTTACEGIISCKDRPELTYNPHKHEPPAHNKWRSDENTFKGGFFLKIVSNMHGRIPIKLGVTLLFRPLC